MARAGLNLSPVEYCGAVVAATAPSRCRCGRIGVVQRDRWSKAEREASLLLVGLALR